jgi:hypothetical protein
MNLEFRIWDKKYKLFSEYGEGKETPLTIESGKVVSSLVEFDNLLLHSKGFLVLENGAGISVADEENFIVQQFTGSLDKKNHQIFEGDIVLFDNPDPYDGQDQLKKIVGYNSRVMGFRLYNFTHEINKYGGTVFFPEQVDVIGNIFEGVIKDGINYGEFLKEK